MCFLYELHEYVEIFKDKNNKNINDDIMNNIDAIEDNIIELYYSKNKNDIDEKIGNMLNPYIIQNKYKFFEELLYNIVKIYHINIDKKKEYYTYLYYIKNIIIE